MVVEASQTFLADTGLGHDNVSPRAIARLSADSILALACLFMAFERFGDWAEILDLVLIVVLPKGDGGFRPIGLFPMEIRLWFRCRLNLTRIWEAQNALPSVFGGPGMGTQKAAYQIAFISERAALM